MSKDKYNLFISTEMVDCEIELTPEEANIIKMVLNSLSSNADEYTYFNCGLINISEKEREASRMKEIAEMEHQKEVARKEEEHREYIKKYGAIAEAFKKAYKEKEKNERNDC